MKKCARPFATALILVLLFGWHCRARAAQVTVDFEAFDGVNDFSNQPVPETSKLSNQLASAYGIVFRSEGAKPYVGVVTIRNSLTNTRGIVAVDENDVLSYLTPVIVEFVRPFDPSLAATTDFVSIRGILFPKDGDKILIEAFDANGALVGTASQYGNYFTALSLRRPGIHSIRISQTLGFQVFANLIFNTPLGDPLRVVLDGRSQQIHWNSESNREYQVQYSSALNSNGWENLGGVVDGNGSIMSASVPVLHEPQRFYRVQLLLPLFEYAIAARGTIDAGGSRILVDSFDSADPNFSTNGRYDGTKESDQGNVAAYQITNSSIVGLFDIYGRISIDPNGSVSVGTNGSVGDSAWHAAGNRGIEPGSLTEDMTYDFPAISAPATNGMLAPVMSNPSVLDATNGYFVSGDLLIANTNLIVTNVVTKLYVSGNFSISGSSGQIVIARGASLKLYVGGSVWIGGQGITNGGDASGLVLYGLPTCTDIDYDAAPSSSGTIYAPNALLLIRGSGSNNPGNAREFNGAAIVRSVRLSSRFSFHYDKNVRRVGPMR